MSVAVYLIIGFFVGAAALYLFQMQDLDRLDQAEIELKQARRDLSRIEEDHEVRVREAIATAKSDYQKKHDGSDQEVRIIGKTREKLYAPMSEMSV